MTPEEKRKFIAANLGFGEVAQPDDPATAFNPPPPPEQKPSTDVPRVISSTGKPDVLSMPLTQRRDYLNKAMTAPDAQSAGPFTRNAGNAGSIDFWSPSDRPNDDINPQKEGLGQSVPVQTPTKPVQLKNPVQEDKPQDKSSVVSNYLSQKNSPPETPDDSDTSGKPIGNLDWLWRLGSNLGGTVSGTGTGHLDKFLEQKRTDRKIDEYDDPDSDISKQYQQIAKTERPDIDPDGLSATALKDHLSPLGLQQRFRSLSDEEQLIRDREQAQKDMFPDKLKLAMSSAQARASTGRNASMNEVIKLGAYGQAHTIISKAEALLDQIGSTGKLEQFNNNLRSKAGIADPNVAQYNQLLDLLAPEIAKIQGGGVSSVEGRAIARKTLGELGQGSQVNKALLANMHDTMLTEGNNYADMLNAANVRHTGDMAGLFKEQTGQMGAQPMSSGPQIGPKATGSQSGGNPNQARIGKYKMWLADPQNKNNPKYGDVQKAIVDMGG